MDDETKKKKTKTGAEEETRCWGAGLVYTSLQNDGNLSIVCRSVVVTTAATAVDGHPDGRV